MLSRAIQGNSNPFWQQNAEPKKGLQSLHISLKWELFRTRSHDVAKAQEANGEFEWRTKQPHS